MSALTPFNMLTRCTTCQHPKAAEINTLLANGQSLRYIEKRYGIKHGAAQRHRAKCIGRVFAEASEVKDRLVNQIVEKSPYKEAIVVYDEFHEQLEFAKELRTAARKYLSDVHDPLRMDITPRANEIEVTYLDHNDMEKITFGSKVIEKPKKKKALLSLILESLKDTGLEPEKFVIKTIDMRKFALDAINTADLCIDKFARMGGAYQQDRKNDQDPARLMEELVAFLVSKGHDRDAATETARKKYSANTLQLGP